MKHLLPCLLLAVAAVQAAPEAPKPEAKAETKAKAKAKTPDPAFAPVQDVAGLPRVLIIGDSISIGYTVPVRRLLDGKANVHRIPVNGGPTLRGTADLARWLGTEKWDVIHFNFGLHDLRRMDGGKRQVEPEAYEQNLRAIVAELRKTGAKLIWATTTPVPEGKLTPPREFGDVGAYNAIAAKVMKENGVAVDDLNAHITPKLAQLQKPHDVHYSPEGYAFLAEAVSRSISEALAK